MRSITKLVQTRQHQDVPQVVGVLFETLHRSNQKAQHMKKHRVVKASSSIVTFKHLHAKSRVSHAFCLFRTVPHRVLVYLTSATHHYYIFKWTRISGVSCAELVQFYKLWRSLKHIFLCPYRCHRFAPESVHHNCHRAVWRDASQQVMDLRSDLQFYRCQRNPQQSQESWNFKTVWYIYSITCHIYIYISYIYNIYMSILNTYSISTTFKCR